MDAFKIAIKLYIEDAAGILGRVGIPDDMLGTVVTLIDALPDSTARDCLVQSLPLGHPWRAPEAMPAADSGFNDFVAATGFVADLSR